MLCGYIIIHRQVMRTNTDNLTAKYRVIPVNTNYYAWQYNNETGGRQDGYAGVFRKSIDRFYLF